MDGPADGNAEICALPSVGCFVTVAFGFLAVVGRRALGRLPGFFVVFGPPDSADG